MNPRRGSTLIELMIVLSILLITVFTIGAASGMIRPWAVEVVLRERALQVLEAEARALMQGRAGAEAEVRQLLLAELPQGRLEQAPAGAGAVRLTVHWRGAARGPSTRTLVVWPRGAGR
jgi:hypothetical protein